LQPSSAASRSSRRCWVRSVMPSGAGSSPGAGVPG